MDLRRLAGSNYYSKYSVLVHYVDLSLHQKFDRILLFFLHVKYVYNSIYVISYEPKIEFICFLFQFPVILTKSHAKELYVFEVSICFAIILS